MTNASRLFAASRVALIVTAMSFALRGGAVGAWATTFHLTNEQVGWVNSTAFWGFTVAMIFGGPLCDVIGLGRILGVAFVGHLVGIFLTIFAWNYHSLYAGTLIFGIANGSVEAACNPLIAALYPKDKTTRLNQFHVWFPGGIVIGGVLADLFGRIGWGWQIQFASMVIPLVIYGIMFLGQKFPQTERVESGVSTSGMVKACFNPVFIIMVICMLMTAATEFGPENWIPNVLSNAGVPGLLVLAWITGLMAVGRQCAGAFVHRLHPIGMLLLSAALSAIGLYALSHSSGAMLFVSATIFAFGVCFFWPTMLGFVNENYPATGALGLAIMGGAGMLSSSYVVPLVGRWYDSGIAARLTPGETATGLAAATDPTSVAHWSKIQAEAGLAAMERVAILPVVLFVVFLLIYLLRKKSPAASAPQHA